MSSKTKITESAAPGQADGLVGVEALRLILWPDPASRPSLRWVRELQARRVIPHIKLGVKVFFEPERVRAALRRFEQTVEA
jgi:hypothetical protein